ncbi:MAG: hypothetical protein KIT11_03640 [Fimbriimonadaceae bacterium]|nr:hypothetical protein [Fimbriimonadaceae bacterium]QYK57010.1 MAG: hypothetical protein KF733_05885 [Fimbriimonadaceae bacterium]
MGVFGFSLVLCAFQIITGTDILFALMVMLFVWLSGATIGVLGGVFNLLGLSVFILAAQQVVVSQIAKAWFLQPADVPLKWPIETMGMYCLGMLGILLGALTFKALRIDRARPLFPPITDGRTLIVLAWILTLIAFARFFILARFGVYEGASGGVYVGGFVGPLRTLTFLPTLAVACGTAAVIVRSEGKRCVGWVNAIAILVPILAGIITAIRADTASALVTFGLTLLAFRFKLKVKHYVIALLAAYAFQFIIFPYSLYARGEGKVRIGTLDQRIAKAFSTLFDVAVDPIKYQSETTKPNPSEPWSITRLRYYGQPLPTLERYSQIIFNDEIVDATIRGRTTGWETTEAGFVMILPRILNPRKEAFGTSNSIAHRGEGIVGKTDYYTQITLSFMVDAFGSFRFPGVFFFSYFIALAYFTVYSLMFNTNLWRNIYVASLAFTTTWIFSEGTIQAQILNVVQNPIYFILVTLPLVLIARTLTKRLREAPFVYEKPNLALSKEQ